MSYALIDNALKQDPTRTSAVRRRFLADMKQRFNALDRVIAKSIVDQDCFGIQPDKLYALELAPATGFKAFAFERTDDKVKAFMAWLEDQQDRGVLEIIRRPGAHGIENVPWSDVYIQSGYAKGIQKGRLDLKRAGYLPKGGAAGVVTFEAGIGSSIAAAMNAPWHAGRLALLYTRTFEDLKTVMNVTDAAIRRSMMDGLTTGLSKGMAEGLHPSVIARNLLKDTEHHLDTIGRVRANMIARTEPARAMKMGSLEEFRRAEAATGLEVVVDILLGPNPCEVCIEIAKKGPYTIDEAEEVISPHPSCVCSPVARMRDKEAIAMSN